MKPMADEYFDIVDENNKATGEKRRRTEAHREGLWHRTVHIYLFREAGGSVEVLVHLRSKDKDQHPNEWDTRFGGHVKAGATPEQTVNEELHDEVGLTIEPNKVIQGGIYKYDGGSNREFTMVYFYRFIESIDSLVFNDKEVQRVKWMAKDEIRNALRTEPRNWAASLSGFEQIMKVLTTKLG